MQGEEEVPRPSVEEMRALRSGVALERAAGLDVVDLAGADRERFLHNLVTCEVRDLPAGASTRGFFTHVKGGVVADATVLGLADRFRLLVPAGRAPAVVDHLAKYRIAERVEIAARGDLSVVRWRGEGSGGRLAAYAFPVPEPGAQATGTIGGIETLVLREARGREPRFLLILPADEEERLREALRGGSGAPDVVELSPGAVELARIEDGELAWGIDYGEANFPQETGEDAAVSYTKGCYLGQEVVARIHYRGGVQRLPRRLRAVSGPAPGRGAELRYEGREVGRLGSLAVEPVSGSVLGLALIHQRAAPGAHLDSAPGTVFESLALAQA